jgi:hypothetical protein
MRDILDVDDEDESVVLLNLLHGRLGVQWVKKDGAGIEARFVLWFSQHTTKRRTKRESLTYVDGLAGVFWCP